MYICVCVCVCVCEDIIQCYGMKVDLHWIWLFIKGTLARPAFLLKLEFISEIETEENIIILRILSG